MPFASVSADFAAKPAVDVTWMTTVTRKLASREAEQMLNNKGTNATTCTKDPATKLAHTTIAAPKRGRPLLMWQLLSQLQSLFSLLMMDEQLSKMDVPPADPADPHQLEQADCRLVALLWFARSPRSSCQVQLRRFLRDDRLADDASGKLESPSSLLWRSTHAPNLS